MATRTVEHAADRGQFLTPEQRPALTMAWEYE